MISRFKDKVIMLTGAAACNPQKQMGFAGETVWRFFKEGGSAAIITDVQDNEGEESVISLTKDGFESFYMHAWPILKEKKLPFILFVSTREVGKHGYMTWKQINEIGSYTGVEIFLTSVFVRIKLSPLIID